MQRPTRSQTVLALAVLAVAGAALYSHAPRAAQQAQPGSAAEAPRPALTVSLVAPRRVELTERLQANGNVAAWQEAIVGAEVGGLRLAEVLANVGDTVRAGEVLARFATDAVQADVAQARAALAQAQAARALAQADARRATALQGTGAMSAQQIQQAELAAQQAGAQVQAAQAALDAQLLRLRHTEVRAPDAGTISARLATVGAVASPGAELFRLVRRGRLEWRAEVSAAELARIHPGDKVELAGADGTQITGQVRVLGPTVDPQTRNALVYVDLPPQAPLRAGMYAHGQFLLGRRQALTVPLSALVLRDGFAHVFELGEGSRVAMRRVQTGQRGDGMVEVTAGLSPQARIVARGGTFLNDGDLVRTAPDSEPNKAQTPADKAQ
jgi:RND family efflux transporter MFP subunit